MAANWIALQPQLPLRLHFTAWAIERIVIQDRTFNRPREVEALMMLADRVNGVDDGRPLPITSTRLRGMIEPFLRADTYKSYEFVIAKIGDGLRAQFTLQAIPYIP